MEIALRQYFLLEHHFVMPEDAVTIIPLEGEGKIEERVEKLYDQLVSNLTWLQAFSAAEVILWGTHSQGMPVSVMLLHQLLQENHIHTQQTAVCMLGSKWLVCQYFEASAARELFDFMDSAKAISERFRRSLAYVLENGVKLTLVGSLQDQVVPLHSGILTSISHPNILRSVYIDKHIYTEDDFLINLVVFAIRLRNAGLPDHGLLVHVSEVLAGSIYAIGGGHSTIYEELDVYLMAIRYLFDHHPKRTDLSYTTATVEVKPFKAKQHLNPFHLPWAVRGVFDDKMILAESWAVDELKRLLQLFQQWTPTSTRLREVKFRLEPLAEHML
ncbi:hypothetical protein BX666DRAFT_1850528 [Dichotomocladium elegans]|nr:hypothetical protein BX666DRAFT_1850528 [Dichotomocladium elegans]